MKMCFLGAWDNQLIFPRQLLQAVGESLVALSPRRSSYLRAKHCLPSFEMLSSQLAFPGFGEPWILQSFCWSFSSQFTPRTARRDFCMPLAEHMRLDPCRSKAELVQLPVAKELYDKQGQKIHENNPFLVDHCWEHAEKLIVNRHFLWLAPSITPQSRCCPAWCQFLPWNCSNLGRN